MRISNSTLLFKVLWFQELSLTKEAVNLYQYVFYIKLQHKEKKTGEGEVKKENTR
jgi:hypothetical protein